MVKTLATGLRAASVDFATLHKQYHPVLAVVKEMIGVIPNCDPVLEIWPPAFRSYNVLVPNLFNLPNVLFTNRSFKESVGLALRRGLRADAITGKRTAKEQAVVDLATGLATIPASLTMQEIRTARSFFTAVEVEWLVACRKHDGFSEQVYECNGY